MLKKRIIPCLDIKDGNTVKGIKFENLIHAGDPVELAKYYMNQSADELVFLDITASIESRKTLKSLVKRVADQINIPFTVGGGINSLEDASTLVSAGADKISINTSALKRPLLIGDIAKRFGNQCVVLAVDVRFENGDYFVYSHGGRMPTGKKLLDWVCVAEDLGAGEILLTSMNHDGTKSGFAIDLIQKVTQKVNLPIIASGGAGSIEHFKDVFLKTDISAALAASVFHFKEIQIPELKDYLKNYNIPIR